MLSNLGMITSGKLYSTKRKRKCQLSLVLVTVLQEENYGRQRKKNVRGTYISSIFTKKQYLMTYVVFFEKTKLRRHLVKMLVVNEALGMSQRVRQLFTLRLNMIIRRLLCRSIFGTRELE